MEPKDTIITLRLFPYILFSDGKEKDQDELGNLVEESDELFEHIRFTPKVAGKLQARFDKKTWLKGSGYHWKWAPAQQSRYSDKIQQRSLVLYFQGTHHSNADRRSDDPTIPRFQIPFLSGIVGSRDRPKSLTAGSGYHSRLAGTLESCFIKVVFIDFIKRYRYQKLCVSKSRS